MDVAKCKTIYVDTVYTLYWLAVSAKRYKRSSAEFDVLLKKRLHWIINNFSRYHELAICTTQVSYSDAYKGPRYRFRQRRMSIS